MYIVSKLPTYPHKMHDGVSSFMLSTNISLWRDNRYSLLLLLLQQNIHISYTYHIVSMGTSYMHLIFPYIWYLRLLYLYLNDQYNHTYSENIPFEGYPLSSIFCKFFASLCPCFPQARLRKCANHKKYAAWLLFIFSPTLPSIDKVLLGFETSIFHSASLLSISVRPVLNQ